MKNIKILTFASLALLATLAPIKNTHAAVRSISNVGFPVVLSVFLLLRFEKKIDELTKAINELVVKLK